MNRRKLIILLYMLLKFQRQRNYRLRKRERERKLRLRRFLARRQLLVNFITTLLCGSQCGILGGTRSQRSIWCKPRPFDFWDSIASWTDLEWRQNFRMSQKTFEYLCLRLSPYISKRVTTFRQPFSVERRVAITIWRLATNVDFRTVAHLFGVGKSTAIGVCQEVCKSIVHQFVVLSYDQAVDTKNIERFKEIAGFPQVAGAIDGCHIPIVAPQNNHTDYNNRKSFYSMVLQAVVDSKYCFSDIYIGWPGRVHDARVFRNSPLYALAERNTLFSQLLPTLTVDGVEIPVLLIGDPAYPLLPWLMKPYTDTGNLTRAQKNFNFKLSSTRMVVENAFGRFKGRWRCLLKRLDTNTEDVPTVVTACCILHNMCETFGDTYVYDSESHAENTYSTLAPVNYDIPTQQIGNADIIRATICSHL